MTLKSRKATKIPSGGMTKRISHAKLFDLKSEIEQIGTELKDMKKIVDTLKETNNTFDTITINDVSEFQGKIVAKEVEVISISEENANDLLDDIVK